MVPCGLLIDLSLWSADLANLERDVRRAEPHVDSFHLDVADGRFAPALLFFPDLVARLRPITSKPLHVHLMVTDPARWAPVFREAGADWITAQVETGFADCDGLAVNLETPVGAVSPYLAGLRRVVMMGTQLGVKGRGLDPSAGGRIRELRDLAAGYEVEIYADGGIRRDTVEALRAAGADAVVAGSLVFGSGDMEKACDWLREL